jgi:hypothetical protein
MHNIQEGKMSVSHSKREWLLHSQVSSNGDNLVSVTASDMYSKLTPIRKPSAHDDDVTKDEYISENEAGHHPAVINADE